ncbi:putative LRR receptor-like serine/threonine-protein kinase [Acorus gramineus]|uniref:non-specific serine/threonine protein kinase n=1 Tax=Acorus gramineus TaxID=55184 RepID=A0AAV8ZX63_ACOGR|nr:putative LRR receptor-like serine/threonine-protein kinase [Acorus gramineus]
MFQRLRISATTSWNISGEPCSGTAIDNATNIDDPTLNPGIKCDCTFNKRKKCRVVRLRMSAMDVTGPIPDEIAMFTRLNFLRISDLSGGSSFSLDLIKNMKSLRTLILRNNKMSGVLPPNMNEFKDLQMLDLSFNNLTGPIPPSLFNSSSLQFLFVGNNSLSGSLPSQKSPVLLNMNLVANNFAIDDLNSSVLPSGLNCLQRNIPCLSESPCKSITASDEILFVDDTENLGAASYYVSDTKRYFGLGLQTGNYTGILVEKDFDIRKKAGKSFKAVKKEYIASVSNNFLEIHFFWAGRGTTSILNQAFNFKELMPRLRFQLFKAEVFYIALQ